MNTGALSDQSYWDSVIESTVLPRIYDQGEYNVSRFDALFRSYIDEGAKTFFEIGCGASAWLPYFKQYYSFNVSGLDYSEPGCLLAERNLDYFGRTPTEVIYCKDIAVINDGECGIHDIVFSYGVVEHFDDPVAVLRQARKLVPTGGQIVTIVPNLIGWYGSVSKVLLPTIFAMHKAIDPKMLEQVHEQAGFRSEFCGYFGTFYLEAIPWTSVEVPFLRRKIIRRIFLTCIAHLARWIKTGLRLAKVTNETERWSPYVVFIGRKG